MRTASVTLNGGALRYAETLYVGVPNESYFTNLFKDEKLRDVSFQYRESVGRVMVMVI
jgi:hypothetical protein